MLPRCFGVLGDPVAHSRSPAMHAAAFAALGLPHRYLAFHVAPARLSAAVRGAAALGFGGLNVTVPHKQAALELCDALTDEARRIGAVNTLGFLDGRIVGHNTDGRGFAAAVRELGPGHVRQAVVLGTGGAARAVVAAIAGELLGPGGQVRWVSRDPGPGGQARADSGAGGPGGQGWTGGAGGQARADSGAGGPAVGGIDGAGGQGWTGGPGGQVRADSGAGGPAIGGIDGAGGQGWTGGPGGQVRGSIVTAGYAELGGGPPADLLVNCTTVGMKGGPAAFPVELDALVAGLAAGARVIDVVYPRPPGGLLDRAGASGARVQDGLEMLLWQGVFALEVWLGALPGAAVVAAMRAALRA